VFVYIHIYAHPQIYMYIYIYIYIYIYTYTHIYTYTYMYIYIHLYMCIYRYMYVYQNQNTYQSMFIHQSIHMYIHFNVYQGCVHTHSLSTEIRTVAQGRQCQRQDHLIPSHSPPCNTLHICLHAICIRVFTCYYEWVMPHMNESRHT